MKIMFNVSGNDVDIRGSGFRPSVHVREYWDECAKPQKFTASLAGASGAFERLKIVFCRPVSVGALSRRDNAGKLKLETSHASNTCRSLTAQVISSFVARHVPRGRLKYIEDLGILGKHFETRYAGIS